MLALLDSTTRLRKMAKQNPKTYGSMRLVEHRWLLSFSSKLLRSFHRLLHPRKLAIPSLRLPNSHSLAHKGRGAVSVQVAVPMLEARAVLKKSYQTVILSLHTFPNQFQQLRRRRL